MNRFALFVAVAFLFQMALPVLAQSESPNVSISQDIIEENSSGDDFNTICLERGGTTAECHLYESKLNNQSAEWQRIHEVYHMPIRLQSDDGLELIYDNGKRSDNPHIVNTQSYKSVFDLPNFWQIKFAKGEFDLGAARQRSYDSQLACKPNLWPWQKSVKDCRVLIKKQMGRTVLGVEARQFDAMQKVLNEMANKPDIKREDSYEIGPRLLQMQSIIDLPPINKKHSLTRHCYYGDAPKNEAISIDTQSNNFEIIALLSEIMHPSGYIGFGPPEKAWLLDSYGNVYPMKTEGLQCMRCWYCGRYTKEQTHPLDYFLNSYAFWRISLAK